MPDVPGSHLNVAQFAVGVKHADARLPTAARQRVSVLLLPFISNIAPVPLCRHPVFLSSPLAVFLHLRYKTQPHLQRY